MIQGTSSSAGKSLMVTALCRIYTRRGLGVSPFKSQNMALNSFVTPGGHEIGRAQALQAAAAKKEPTVDMNPVLLKPESDGFSQVVLLGKPWKRLAAGEYFKNRQPLWDSITRSMEVLQKNSDLLIAEGAGSPAEINLKNNDIVNMAVARHLSAPVLLTADIDRGGVFAFLYGTLELLETRDKELVKGFIINKFRGDPSLLTPGLSMLEELTGGRPTLGVIPYFRNLLLAQEDSVFLDENRSFGSGSLEIAVIRLPHISNYDDFDALMLEKNISLRFVSTPAELGSPGAVILPGSKTTMTDLRWLKENGLAGRIRELARRGTAVAGICGGFQMLGNRISDPAGVESPEKEAQGLGLIEMDTFFNGEKKTTRESGLTDRGFGKRKYAGVLLSEECRVEGYEIHMGESVPGRKTRPLFYLDSGGSDGAFTRGGQIWGTYLHGVFDLPGFRRRWIAMLGGRAEGAALSLSAQREVELDRLADGVEEHLDMALLDRIIGL